MESGGVELLAQLTALHRRATLHTARVHRLVMGGAHSLSNAAKQKHTDDGSGHGLSWGLSAMQGYRPTMEVLAPHQKNTPCTPGTPKYWFFAHSLPLSASTTLVIPVLCR